MAPPPRNPDLTDDAGVAGRSDTGTPRWVKIFAIIAVILVVALVIGLLTGTGGHGPGRHAGIDASDRTAAAAISEDRELPGGVREQGALHG